MIWSLAESRYQLGLVFHAATVCLPDAAASPYGTCDASRNSLSLTSGAKAWRKASLLRNRKPSADAVNGDGPLAGGGLRLTGDSPMSGAKAAM